MAEKIGFIRFNYFDGPSPTEYDAYKKLERRLEPENHVKTLAETHPPQPPIRTEPPAFDRTPDVRVYKLAAELSPLMDEYHDHVLDVSRIKERVKYIERYRFNNDIAELRYYRHIDLLHAWIMELLFERVYKRLGRTHQTYEKVAKHEWKDTVRFFREHRDKRVDEAKIYPDLHKKEMVHLYRFDIKQPNEKKGLQKTEEHILADRHVVADARTHMLHLRQLMTDMLFDEIRMHLRHQFIEKRNQADERSRWHMHDVLRAFDKAWMHAWDSKDTFKALVRRGIFEQAEIYPRLFRKAIRDPYEIEIREPNEKDMHEKIEAHILRERQHVKLIQLEADAGRLLTKMNKLELAAYRQLNTDRLNEKIDRRELDKHILINRKDERDLEQRDHVYDARRVESQGYQLLAGRMIPQPKFGIDTDFSTTVPLALGIHGSPAAPEHVAPSPLRLEPPQQRELWTKIRTTQDEELRNFLNERNEDWHGRTQVVRQNMAAIEYGEQKTKEWVRPLPLPEKAEIKPREPEPVKLTSRPEPIKLETPLDLNPIITKKDQKKPA